MRLPRRHPWHPADICLKQRIYTSEEIAALLERTADLQRQSSGSTRDHQGLSLDELEMIASEAGLEPVLLRQAAAELDQPHRSLFETSSGTSSTHVFAERWVPGRFTNELWEDIVAELRHRFDSTMGLSIGMPHIGLSTTETIGRTAEWRHTNAWGVETRIMMRQSGDRVRIRLSRKVGWASPVMEGLLISIIPVGFAALTAGVATESVLWTILVAMLTLAACLPGFTWIDRAWRRKKDRELEEIGDHIAHMVAGHASADDAARRPTNIEETPRIRHDEEFDTGADSHRDAPDRRVRGR